MVYSTPIQSLHGFESSERVVETVAAKKPPAPLSTEQSPGQHQQGSTLYPEKRNVISLLNYMNAPGSHAYAVNPAVSAYSGKAILDPAKNMTTCAYGPGKFPAIHKGAGLPHKGPSNAVSRSTHKNTTMQDKGTKGTVIKHYKSDHAPAPHAERKHSNTLKKGAVGPPKITAVRTVSSTSGKNGTVTSKHEPRLISTKETVKTTPSTTVLGKVTATTADRSRKTAAPSALSSSTYLARPILSTASSSTITKITLPKEEPSPYADLLEKLRGLEIGKGDDNNNNANADLIARLRHVKIVNQIYDAVLRTQKAQASPTPRRNRSINTQQIAS
ncbi:hypothetical protein BX666DRAFT_1949404 [Dichotomocladium elegans]|nr:hypothetical protein BX666DRAFT_1949404 [Dichotomocladium elegans]